MAYSIYSKAGTDEAISSALADSLPTAPADIGAATAAQGALADTAVQPEDLGTAAAADAGDFATAAQGALATAGASAILRASRAASPPRPLISLIDDDGHEKVVTVLAPEPPCRP